MSDASDDEFHRIPALEDNVVSIRYKNVCIDSPDLSMILRETPKPKGRTSFSTIHIVAPTRGEKETVADMQVDSLKKQCNEVGKTFHVYGINLVDAALNVGNPLWEYKAVFEITSELLVQGADRASLVIFVGGKDSTFDAFSAFIGMLPFRGISVALLSQRTTYGDLSSIVTPSQVFRVDAAHAARMGMFPVCAVFGGLESMDLEVTVQEWHPMSTEATLAESPDDAAALPFKIGGLVLPMLNHSATYTDAVAALCKVVEGHYNCEHEPSSSSSSSSSVEGGNIRGGFYPIVSCGETCDALGYGTDVLDGLTRDNKREGYYFSHKSGENNKCSENYASSKLFARVAYARKNNLVPLIVAVGGGVNGNSIGLIAALTGSDFIEVPTTPMHFNDATTSAKKAFSLVKDGTILSKNILGAFYLPLLVFCVSETTLTISSANAHAAVGEATKTMNMLGVANSAVGAADYSNILGASEFASDFTKILTKVEGFEKLVTYISSDVTKGRLREIKKLGRRISQLRAQTHTDSSNRMCENGSNSGDGDGGYEKGKQRSKSVAAANNQPASSASAATLPSLAEEAVPVSVFQQQQQKQQKQQESAPPATTNVLFASLGKGSALYDTNRVGPVDTSNMNDGEGVTAHFQRQGLRTSLSFAGIRSTLSPASSLEDLAVGSTNRSRSGSHASEEDGGCLLTYTTRSRSNSRTLLSDSSDESEEHYSVGADLESTTTASGTGGIDSTDNAAARLATCLSQRRELMQQFRQSYYDETPEADKLAIKDFLTTINMEIVKAKAMFLAYSDPFEKYRALLFEYAHTLGHGIEAFANALYARAESKGIYVPSATQRLHGQCVGMAVTWAGEMSKELGLLEGGGFTLHQSFVYLFNRHGGFTFTPLRRLCERLDVDVEELVDGVLKVVRRDNKRGYCNCSSSTASVDQLVVQRPGKMLRSHDPNAELRYLVEVDESLQANMIRRAWAGEFDLVADLSMTTPTTTGDSSSKEKEAVLSFVPFRFESEVDGSPRPSNPNNPRIYQFSSTAVSKHIHGEVAALYAAPVNVDESTLYQCQPCTT